MYKQNFYKFQFIVKGGNNNTYFKSLSWGLNKKLHVSIYYWGVSQKHDEH